MIKILKTQGWLVVAAALTIGLSACTSDELVTGEQQLASGAKGLTVTVGAGFADDASTRSAVVYDNTEKTRKLTFTSGDRLYVLGNIDETEDEEGLLYYKYKFSGMLSVVEGSISQDGKSAYFNGDLTLKTPVPAEYGYNYETNANAIKDFDGKNPITMSTGAQAYLVPQDALEDKDYYYIPDVGVFAKTDLAADVNTLMTKKMSVNTLGGEYDTQSKKFILEANGDPILNCVISGLEPNTSYNLYYVSNPESLGMPFTTPLKADASGKATFAFFGDCYRTAHLLVFEPLTATGDVDTESDKQVVDLGSKNLKSKKVYNISKTAYPEGYSVDIEINATNPKGVSEAIASALESITGSAPINFILKGTVTTASNDKDIIIPTDENDMILTFNNVPSNAGGTLGIKTNKAGNDPSSAKNKLSIIMPDGNTDISLNLDAPTTTVTLKSASGGEIKFKEVISNTAFNTLVIDNAVTVNNVDIQEGTVMVKNEGLLESWTFAPKSNDDKVVINQEGKIEPLIIERVDEDGDLIKQSQIIQESGEAYCAQSLKVVKDDADYANMYFLLNDPNMSPLKVITICDGAVLKTNWISMETIEGIGTAKIDYQLNINDDFNIGYTIGYGTDENAKWYQHQCDLYHIKTLKNIIFSEPEVILSESKQAEVAEKEAEGYVQFPTQVCLDVNETIEDGTFNFEYVHFCPWESYPLVKGCKFGKTGETNTIDIDALDPRGNAFDINSTYSMSFQNCTFTDNTLFNIKFGTYSGGTIDFTNCTYGSNEQSFDNLELLDQIIVGQVKISINGIEKYQTSYNDAKDDKWEVSEIPANP